MPKLSLRAWPCELNLQHTLGTKRASDIWCLSQSLGTKRASDIWCLSQSLQIVMMGMRQPMT